MKVTNELKNVLKKFSKFTAIKVKGKSYWTDGSGHPATNLKDTVIARLADRGIIAGSEEAGYKMTNVGFSFMATESI